MKRGGPLKRYTPLKVKKGFKVTRSQLAKVGKSDTAKCKERIQALLRELAIRRDKGCVLAPFQEEAGMCSGVLQGEHLVTRANSISYGDMRNVVCLCMRHHIHWKPKHSLLYWDLIEHVIGVKRMDWVRAVEKDRRPHRYTAWDWQKTELDLAQQLKKSKPL